MAEQLALARDVLDKQIVDVDGWRMGRVDGIALRIAADGPPEVEGLELGFVVLAARVDGRLAAGVRWLRRRFRMRRSARYVIPWQEVLEVETRHLRVNLYAAETPANDWEEWLLGHVLARLPGTAQRAARRKGKPPRLPKVEGP
jgi:hypothetical protein